MKKDYRTIWIFCLVLIMLIACESDRHNKFSCGCEGPYLNLKFTPPLEKDVEIELKTTKETCSIKIFVQSYLQREKFQDPKDIATGFCKDYSLSDPSSMMLNGLLFPFPDVQAQVTIKELNGKQLFKEDYSLYFESNEYCSGYDYCKQAIVTVNLSNSNRQQ